ncbi:hypothetical protein [Streptomyces sp. NPDC088400]|uniref:hypothetical protein n=1 Tax=Streptomyces sp. NPDC088400 TaxID=3365861 RepID=UPI003823BED1
MTPTTRSIATPKIASPAPTSAAVVVRPVSNAGSTTPSVMWPSTQEVATGATP